MIVSTMMITRPLSLVGRRELFMFLGAYLVYSASRYVSVGDLDTAVGHAEWIVSLERSLSVNVESAVQTGLAGGWVIWVLNQMYLAAQLIVVPGTLILLYKLNRAVYVKLRNTVLATWLIAMPIYALYPTAPPRLAGMGMVDTITAGGGVRLDSSLTTSFYNPLAAVPSLHAGFALAVSVALFMAFRPRWAKALALTWAPLIGLAVVATGNHFVFDIAAGVVVTVAGYVAGNAVDRKMAGRRRWRPALQVPGAAPA
jgi:membrane-associated phospholipid phosphatase